MIPRSPIKWKYYPTFGLNTNIKPNISFNPFTPANNSENNNSYKNQGPDININNNFMLHNCRINFPLINNPQNVILPDNNNNILINTKNKGVFNYSKIEIEDDEKNKTSFIVPTRAPDTRNINANRK